MSEFDSYFEFRVASYMVKNGLLSPYWPTQWIDTHFWFPTGINMATETLPSIPLTAASLYDLFSLFGVNVDFMTFCSFLPVITGTLCVLIIYLIGKEIGGKPVGFLAAIFLALEPSFISRTNLGWFETEMTTFSFLLFFFMFPRAIDEERSVGSSVRYSLACAACLAYSVMGWGAAYYLLDLTVLFVFVLLVLRRYTRRVLLAYSLTFGLGLLVAIQAPFLAPRYVTSYAVLPVLGVFLLLCLNEVLRNLASARAKFALAVGILVGLIGSFTVIFVAAGTNSIAGKFIRVLNPFLASANPLVESVAEHRISSWGSIYYDLGIGILFFAVGLFFVARNPTTKNLFVLLFGVTAAYFAASMVRLLYLLAPAFALLAGVGIVGLLKPFVSLIREPPKVAVKKKFGLEHVGKEFSGAAVFLIFIVLTTNLAFSPQYGGVPRGISSGYAPITISSGSLAAVPSKPVSEWLDMLTYLSNLHDPSTVVVAWWDYGLWITVEGNVTTLSDNTTINNTAIENTGFAFMANESNSLKMLKQYDPKYTKYVLVFDTFSYQGSWVDWAGGDNGKWTWMAKISGNAQQRFINQSLIDPASSWQNETTFGNYTSNKWVWNDVGLNSTVYKLMSWGKDRWCQMNGVPDPDAGNVTQPTYFQEEFFSGETLSSTDSQNYFGGLVPLVCLYKINWDLYNKNYPST